MTSGPSTPANATAATPGTSPDEQLPPPASPAPPEAIAYVTADLEIVFTGDSAGFAVGTENGGANLRVARASVDFGDGSPPISVSGSCTGQGSSIRVGHVFAAPGRYIAALKSMELCYRPTAPDLTHADVGRVLVLAAASPATVKWPTCTTFQLRMTGLGHGAGLGNVGVLFRVKNISKAGCTLFGFPGLRLVSSSGALLPTTVEPANSGAYLFPAIRPHLVALAPGSYAAFDLGYGDNPFGPTANQPYEVACPAARAVRITLPGTNQYGTAVVPMAPCNGLVFVSPIFPGPDWISFQ